MSINATLSSPFDPFMKSNAWLGVMAVAVIALCTLAFGEGLSYLVVKWGYREEYSHAYLIPAISLWLLWTRRSAVLASIGPSAPSGIAVFFLSANMLVFGEIGSISLLVQIGYLVALIGLALLIGGYRLLKICLFPIFFLSFAIPLPTIIEVSISWKMQLISSELGVKFIRLFGVPVFLDGNIIDLGEYQLQVVEACSGLRYLFPFLSLGVLSAYFFNAPLWVRVVVVVSTIPITIVMNSFRIGVIGLTVNLWGTEMAEGALHFFEGWIIFMACAVMLALEIWLIAKLLMGKKFFEVVGPPAIHSETRASQPVTRRKIAMLVSAIMLISGAYLIVLVKATTAEEIPDRSRFFSFPNTIGEWTSTVSHLETNVKAALLGLDDYILADFRKPESSSINLYIGYYPVQKKEHSPHNPRRCIPGGGWQITDLARPEYVDKASGLRFPVTRTVITRGSEKMLVYYWFEGRGRRVANEYLSKWYIYKDSFTSGRTDGSLVRLITGIAGNETTEVADRRLQQFMKQMLPLLGEFVPA